MMKNKIANTSAASNLDPVSYVSDRETLWPAEVRDKYHLSDHDMQDYEMFLCQNTAYVDRLAKVQAYQRIISCASLIADNKVIDMAEYVHNKGISFKDTVKLFSDELEDSRKDLKTQSPFNMVFTLPVEENHAEDNEKEGKKIMEKENTVRACTTRTYPTDEEYLEMYKTMTRRQIAKKLHMSSGTLSSWLNRHIFSLEVAAEIDKIAATRRGGRASKTMKEKTEEAKQDIMQNIASSFSSEDASLLNEKLYRDRDVTIGEYLEMYRTMSQLEIAEKLGVSEHSISNAVYTWKKKHRDSGITKEIKKITSEKSKFLIRANYNKGNISKQKAKATAVKTESDAIASLAEKYSLAPVVLDNFLSSLSSCISSIENAKDVISKEYHISRDVLDKALLFAQSVSNK